MAYTAWSVVFGEQPTAAKWNQLGENDAGFKDGSNFDADLIKSKHIDWADTGAGDAGGIWWEEIGRTTLGSAGDTITVSSIAARKYLKILCYGVATGGTLDTNIIFNNDTGSNYAVKYQVAMNGTVTDGASLAAIPMDSGSPASGAVNVILMEIFNNATGAEKHFYSNNQHSASGAATVPTVIVHKGKWANTSAQINRIDWRNAGTGDFAIGSEVVVLGHD